MTRLVRLAHLCQQLQLGRPLVGLLGARALESQPVHPRGERALEESTEIPWREDQLARALLHRRSLFRANSR